LLYHPHITTDSYTLKGKKEKRKRQAKETKKKKKDELI